LCCWDPIGVANEPNAQDEYDSYIGGVLRLLTTGASDGQIAEWLWRQTKDSMGLSEVQKEDMCPTVVALRKITIETV